ncbi:hypothetical protein, partial [Desulfoplanes formicivorans]|uniref:hypothetical protein n=1 Tax=Desulfoplanes formicivorans TaxID=1592317 RepID=UPI001C4077D1
FEILVFCFLLCGNNRNTKLQGSLQVKIQSFQYVYFALKSKSNPESRVINIPNDIRNSYEKCWTMSQSLGG